jgi:hypothetical protein
VTFAPVALYVGRYNMLLWRMCRLFMRQRETAMADGAGPMAKADLRGLTHRLARVVSTTPTYLG